MHHIHGAEIAEELLKKFGYDKEKIDLVKKCIVSHRGSVILDKSTIEEKCVADADAISHFDNIPSLLYLAYVEKNMDIEEGKEFVKGKLQRSYQKLSEESKQHYIQKYKNTMEVLG